MVGAISEHLRANVVGYIALFVSLSGVTYAVNGPLKGNNTVGSADIINGEVKTIDIARGGVRTIDVRDDGLSAVDIANNGSLSSAEIDEGSLYNDNSLVGADIDESSLFNNDSLTGDDIGSLTGADIEDGSLKGADIDESSLFNDDSLTGTDINESTLGAVPAATTAATATTASNASALGGVGLAGMAGPGRGSSIQHCRDDDGNGESCATVTLTLTNPSRVLVIGSGDLVVHTFNGNLADRAYMNCDLRVDGTDIYIGGDWRAHGTPGDIRPASFALITNVLSAAEHSFELYCTQTDADLDLNNASVIAVAVGNR